MQRFGLPMTRGGHFERSPRWWVAPRATYTTSSGNGAVSDQRRYQESFNGEAWQVLDTDRQNEVVYNHPIGWGGDDYEQALASVLEDAGRRNASALS